MDKKRKEEEVLELTADEIDELVFEEQLASGEYDEEVPEYYFSNPDPYAKVEPRPDDAPKREFTFDEKASLKSAVFRSIFLALDLGKLRIFKQKPFR